MGVELLALLVGCALGLFGCAVNWVVGGLRWGLWLREGAGVTVELCLAAVGNLWFIILQPLDACLVLLLQPYRATSPLRCFHVERIRKQYNAIPQVKSSNIARAGTKGLRGRVEWFLTAPVNLLALV
jgi:hypothetical protein